MGALQEVGVNIIIMYRQVVQPSTLTNCRDQRSEDNLGYDYIYGQATEAQSNRYYGSTQNHRSGQLSTLLCQRTKISYFNWGEGGKVSRPSSRRIHWPTMHQSRLVLLSPHHVEEWKSLVSEVGSAWHFWKCTVVSHPTDHILRKVLNCVS